MSPTDYTAETSVDIDSKPEAVWDALTDPKRIQDYMFGATVDTDWEVGSPITWKGEWEGTEYEDKGEILEFDPPRQLGYSHYSPLSGEPDIPGNYHNVTIGLSSRGDITTVVLTQDNNETAEQRDHSEENWAAMLGGLKKHVEADAG